MVRRDGFLHQSSVTVFGRVQLGLAAAKGPCTLALAAIPGQHRQPLERRRIVYDRHQPFQRLVLGCRIPDSGSQPTAELEPFILGKLGSGNKSHRPPRLGQVAGGARPIETDSPDGRIMRPPLHAAVEPAQGFHELAGLGRQARPGQPDPVVVGC